MQNPNKEIRNPIARFMNLDHFETTDNSELLTSPLSEIYKNSNKFCSTKWEHYFEIYERYLNSFVKENKAVNLLEIGVLNGGSLEMFKTYLPKNSFVVGLDINPKCQDIQFSPGIKFFHGSASDQKFMQKYFSKAKFDVIIDDGSHVAKDVISSFDFLFSKLNLGGVYLIEDCHTAYWKEFGGGYKNPNNHIEYFKKIIDALHFKYFNELETISTQEKNILNKLNQEIACISFYDSMIAIEKYRKVRVNKFRHYSNNGQDVVLPKEFCLNFSIPCDENTKFEKIYKD